MEKFSLTTPTFQIEFSALKSCLHLYLTLSSESMVVEVPNSKEIETKYLLEHSY